MSEELDKDILPFVWNVFFMGREGFREHFKVSALTAGDLVTRRAATLAVLASLEATPDVRKQEWSRQGQDKPSQDKPKSTETPEAAMLRAAKETIAKPGAPEALTNSKLAKYAKKES